jgi:hypothetical protein
MKIKSVVVITLFVVACSFASAQTFGSHLLAATYIATTNSSVGPAATYGWALITSAPAASTTTPP